jgi:hypothetical protein
VPHGAPDCLATPYVHADFRLRFFFYKDLIMMNLSKIMLMTAALVAANMSFAQSSSVGAKATADVPVGTVTTTTGASVSTPSAMPAPAVSGTASTTTSTATSSDPYVQKRQADSAAKKDYKMRKKMAKAEYKEEKAEAKSDMKGEKRMSARERKAALAAEKESGTAKPIGN